ncbi:MAG: KpsF/GutQ family sugar-phosphate isomerase [Alphaproteobacteria bacterium]
MVLVVKMKNTDIAGALEVLRTEIKGLEELAKTLDGNFTLAVEAIDSMKQKKSGRLIVAGIGKSGHVGRKIAATLASTGTPAYYVHPGEASHGDLGMIGNDDIVVLFSNSGENAELSDLIHYTRRYSIKLVAVTAKPQSTLAKHADIVLLLPTVPEACPNGLAPTTSTTMMMALGDALAVALLHRSNLTPEQFHAFHPGGKLGQRLMKVSDLMIKFDDLPLIDESANMKDALLVLTGENLGAVIVVGKDKNLKGIITDGDLKRHLQKDDTNFLQTSVGDIMTKQPKTVDAAALGVEAVNLMTKSKGVYLTSLIVLENGKLAGMIRLQDCLQAGLV